jgi:tetratricopeptide (TPR) repeat protein
VRANDLSICLLEGGVRLLRQGARAQAEATWREFAELAERTRDARAVVLASGPQALLAYFDGRLEEALAIAQSALERGRGLSVRTDLDDAKLLFLLGRGSDAVFGPPDAVISNRVGLARRGLLLAYLGRHDEARELRERFGNVGSDEDESGVHILTNLLEAAILRSDTETVAPLVRRLAPLADQLAVSGAFLGFGCSYGRLLGDGARLLGRPDEAVEFYHRGLAVCAKTRFRPETAVIRFRLAELWLERSGPEHQSAFEHLGFAIEEFRAMKMQPWLERALRYQGLPHAEL